MEDAFLLNKIIIFENKNFHFTFPLPSRIYCC